MPKSLEGSSPKDFLRSNKVWPHRLTAQQLSDKEPKKHLDMNWELFLNKRYYWIFTVLLLSFPACGYQFAGGGNLPLGITSVQVKIFKNRSTETGIESLITNDLIYEFTRSDKFTVTKSDKAEGIITGIVKSVRTDTIFQKRTGTTLTRRVKVIADIKLTDRKGTVIWSDDNISENEAYDVVADGLADEPSRRAAINRLSKRLAEKIFDRLTEGF